MRRAPLVKWWWVDQTPEMLTRGLALFVVFGAALLVGCDAFTMTPQAYSFRSGLVFYQPTSEYDQELPDGGVAAHRLLTLKDQAGQDFACDPTEIRARPRDSKGEGSIFIAEGCGHIGAYLLVVRTDTTTHAKGREGTLYAIITERFIALNVDDPVSGVHVIERKPDMIYEGEPKYSSPGWFGATAAGTIDFSFASLTAYVRDWSELVGQGSRDLDCPRASILPYFRYAGWKATDWPIAEGCGKRATYLPGRFPPYQISAVAPIK